MELGVSHVQNLSSSTPIVDNIFDKYNKNLVPIRSLSDHDIKKITNLSVQLNKTTSATFQFSFTFLFLKYVLPILVHLYATKYMLTILYLQICL